MAEELFRSADLLVRQVAAERRSACCVVTFDSFTDLRTLDRPGFGEAFLHASGIDAVHVMSRENDWYHYPEMANAMACAAAATARYQRVVAYGSSMGAYAAIRFGGLAGANVLVALSPQFSIDPAVVWWERRWLDAGKRFNPRWERGGKFPVLDEAYVVYDPEHIDHRHVDLLARHLRFDAIRVNLAGHPVTGLLADIGLLQAMILEVAAGAFDPSEFERRALEGRSRSPQYLFSLAERRPRRKDVDLRVALLREALALAPDDPGVVCRLAIELRHARQFDEALALHRRALDQSPGHAFLLFNYSVTLELSGQIEAALAVMEDLSARTNGTLMYQSRLKLLRTQMHRAKRMD